MIPMHPKKWIDFWRKIDVDEESGCWHWLGGIGDFPRFCIISDANSVREIILNNRVSRHEDFVMLCQRDSCVNPDHIETPVTSSRGGSPLAHGSPLSSGVES